MEELSKANCLFTLDLFRTLITLHFDQVQDVHSGFQKMQSEINRADFSCLLKVANRLYGEKSYNFLEEFFTSSMKFFGEKMSAVDFRNAANEIRQEINKWVELQTADKIKDLLADGSVNSDTRLVLVNAIYFKGSWAETFDERDTVEMPFKLSKKASKPVKMMYQKKTFFISHIQEFNLHVLELPYAGNDFSMIILLPDDIMDDSTGLKQLEQELTLEKLQEWTHPNCMRKLDVHVHLPKFKLEGDYELKSPLSSLGMGDVFDSSKADLTGMSATRDLYVSKVVHKSFVEVNEEGTEAAAATAVMTQSCMVMHEESFTADHPFLFFIRHNKTNSILFFGRYSSP
ncbi:leukocyte elastase inhibitor A-like isoform X2 [Stegostoma tigrinum]|uniref:leukocyte elastase inhibitor A-like isoform X2 n=1 Tax=Stegostoma tigrinum TaxID=3053191 RepID=UPI00202B0981|nr:leukocyte elastase inhibitor A-like isoform X2 [Stegostoma tigrinum]